MTPRKKYPVYEVEWIDSHVDNDWMDVKEAAREFAKETKLLVWTVGYLVRQGEETVTLCLSISGMGVGASFLTIPKRSIRKLTCLRELSK